MQRKLESFINTRRILFIIQHQKRTIICSIRRTSQATIRTELHLVTRFAY